MPSGERQGQTPPPANCGWWQVAQEMSRLPPSILSKNSVRPGARRPGRARGRGRKLGHPDASSRIAGCRCCPARRSASVSRASHRSLAARTASTTPGLGRRSRGRAGRNRNSTARDDDQERREHSHAQTRQGPRPPMGQMHRQATVEQQQRRLAICQRIARALGLQPRHGLPVPPGQTMRSESTLAAPRPK